MPVRYLCDSCGHRGFDTGAETADHVLCEMCGEAVLQDPDTPASTGHDGFGGTASR